MSKKNKPLILPPDSMRYHKRTAPVPVDEDGVPVLSTAFSTDKPGKYVGLGRKVIKERRKLPRAR